MINTKFYLFQHLYPKSQIDVYVTILEDDGCTLAAALTVSGLALADAAIQMFDTLVGASVVTIKAYIFLDLSKSDMCFLSPIWQICSVLG